MPYKSDYNPFIHQTPTPIIEVYLPSNKSTSEPDYAFRPYRLTANTLPVLQSYNFSEAVDDLDGSFSFSVEYGEIGGKSVFDIIPIRSVVKIFEVTSSYNYYPSFVGIIRRRKISKQMTNSGLKKLTE